MIRMVKMVIRIVTMIVMMVIWMLRMVIRMERRMIGIVMMIILMISKLVRSRLVKMTTCNSLTLIKLYLPQCASYQSEHQIKLLERFTFMPIAHVHPYFWHCMIFHCCTWNTLCCKFLSSFKITVNFNTKK